MFSLSTARPFCISLLLASLSACTGSADTHAKKAESYAADSKLAEAVIEYQVALQKAPTRGDLRFRLAEVYIRDGNGESALAEALRAADLLPEDKAAQLLAGDLLLRAGKFEDAKTRGQRAIAVDKDDVSARILVANASAGLRDVNAAIAEYEQALALDPSRDRVYANLGAVHAVEGDLTAAEANFRKAVAVGPRSIGAHLALAQFLWASGRVTEAEVALKDALEIDGHDLTANRALGLFYLGSGRAGEAEPYFQAMARKAHTAASLVSLAQYYVIVRRYDDARAILTGLLQKPETRPAAVTALAAIDVAAGRQAEAMRALSDLVAASPGETAARLLLARLLFDAHRYDEALTHANAVVTATPDSTMAGDAYLVIGQANVHLDRPADAIDALERATKLQARPVRAALELAGIHLTNGDAERAGAFAQQAVTLAPNALEPRALMVRVLIAEDRVAQAREELKPLLARFAGTALVQNLDGAQRMASGDLAGARSAYARAAALSPQDVEAVEGLVRIDLQTGRTAEARTRVDRAVSGAHTVDFLVLAARTYSTTKDNARAVAFLERALEADPTRLPVYGMLCELYVRQGNPEAARRQVESLIARNPNSISGNTMLGMLLEIQGKASEAEAQYRKVLQMDRTAPVASNNLAWLYVSTDRNLDEALQLAQNAQRHLQDDPDVSDTLGWIYYKKRIPSAAVRLLESSVKRDPANPVRQYHLGMVYVALGEDAQARATLTRALALDANFDGASEARATLAKLGS